MNPTRPTVHSLPARIRRPLLPCLLPVLLAGSGLAHASASAPEDMAALYKTTCAICHEVPETKAPPTDTLRRLPAANILMAMEFGKMQPQASVLKQEQRVKLAKWLAADEDAKRDAWIAAKACAKETPVPVTGRANWGLGRDNTRAAEGVRIDRDNVGRLELLWSVALPSVTTMRSQPVVAGDTVFLGSKGAHLLALDRGTGCVRWSLATEAPVHSALTLDATPDGVATLFFADEMATVYAVNATNGQLRWKQRVKWFPTSIVSGPATYFDGRLYVPLSSFEVAAAGLPTHECCRTHGGIAALDATTGNPLWRFDTTAQASKTYVNRDGVQMWGPSGAVVWNAPTIDAKRGALYFGTGQNSSSPATDTSDAIFALDLKTGEKRWVFQALADDAWNAACLSGGASCPKENGPDFDFGASVMLVHRDKGDLLLAGQKSGEVFALDPDKGGAVVWRRRVGSGSSNGGVHHGMATDGERVYVPVADPERKIQGYVPKPGVYALSVDHGRSALVAAGAARLHLRRERRTAGRPRRDGEGQVGPHSVAGVQLLLRAVRGRGLRERAGLCRRARRQAARARRRDRPAAADHRDQLAVRGNERRRRTRRGDRRRRRDRGR